MASLLQTEERRAALLEARVRQALLDGQEPLARETMHEQLRAAQHVDQLRELWQRQYTGTQRLQALLAALEGKFADIAHRQQLLQAYQQLMRAQHTLVSALSDGAAEGLIAQTEDVLQSREYLLAREFITEAYRELADRPLGARELPTDLPLTEQIDSALAQMRSELGLPARPRSSPVSNGE